MLKFLDVPTLSFCSMLSSAAFGTVFLVLWQRRRSERHLLYWSMSNWIYAFAILAFQSTVANNLTVATALSAISGVSDMLMVCGVYRLDGLPAFRRWMVVPIVAEIVGTAGPALVSEPQSAWLKIGSSLGSSIALGLAGAAILREGDRFAASRGRKIAGFALLAYLPAYAVALIGELNFKPTVDLLSLIPTLADQLLLGVLNLGLLAIPTERAHQRLREAASRDYLTGAWNRSALADQATELLETGAALIAMDIDHFKEINDQHGHAAGDQVLITTSRIVSRLADNWGGGLFRIGGDEFVAILPKCSSDDARLFAGTLQNILAASEGPHATASMGIALVEKGASELESALNAADRALYRAKSLGRNYISD